MDENWKPIPGYEDAYEVSDRGRIRSVPREVMSGCCIRKTRAIIRRTFLGDKGEARLFLSVEGRRKVFYVSALVLEAFVGPRPAAMEARHRDGNMRDDTLKNLWWGPQASRPRDPAPLTETDRAILALKGKTSRRQTAKKFKVDPGVVSRLWALELETN